MRIALSVLLLLHGAAHLVGFLAPWGLLPAPHPGAAPPPQTNVLLGGRVTIEDTTARGLGVIWLVVGLAFVMVAFGLWRQSPWSRTAYITVVLVSLALSIAWWPVARIGVLVNALLLLVPLALGYRIYRSEMRDQRNRVLSGSSLVTTTRGVIEYAVAGQGAPVLVLHGTGGGWDQGLHAAAGLVPHGFRLIAPSRFGYLRTPMPNDASPETEADTWAAFLDALDIDRVAVISFSAGATPAVQLVLRHPDRVSSLTLVVPAAGGLYETIAAGPPAFVMKVLLRFDLPMWVAMRASPRTLSNLVAVPWSLVDTLTGLGKAEYDATVGMLMPISMRRHGMAYDAQSQSGTLPVLPIEKITTPTMAVSAADDLYQTLRVARRTAQLIPNARLLAFESGGHLLLGHGDEMWPQIAVFMRSAAIHDRWDAGASGTPALVTPLWGQMAYRGW
jgi:2-hydroxy-6-oxonona-2,4-dienedioate hydrolase